jgi:ketosteroid isomerase-like protein
MLLTPANIRKPALTLAIALIAIALTSAVFAGTLKDKLAQPKPPSASQSRATTSDADQIRRTIAQYAQSIADADTTLASQIWSDSPDVSFIHPLGHEHGLAQIEQNVYNHLMGETFSERKLSPRDISVHVYGDAAWAEFYWDFAAKFRKDGSPITTHGRETQIYSKEKGAWRLVHVHYSGMPVTEGRQGF